jgi:hypothetical protein
MRAANNEDWKWNEEEQDYYCWSKERGRYIWGKEVCDEVGVGDTQTAAQATSVGHSIFSILYTPHYSDAYYILEDIFQ